MACTLGASLQSSAPFKPISLSPCTLLHASTQVRVYYDGAKKNHTFPASFCTEDGIDLDKNGTGMGNYTCSVTNATLPEPLVFTSRGIISGAAGCPAQQACGRMSFLS